MSLNSSIDYTTEPNIRKAKFILSNTHIYTLDFDYNIQMRELKLLIQKAAHLKKNGFRLFSNGVEYTQYNDEIFVSLFPNQQLVVFTLEKTNIEFGEENELLLELNTPCPEHIDKFLLYYCFNCGTSICSNCFTYGKHKGHLIQDKCFYLLPSKYLVQKMFEGISQKPYEDYTIEKDLSNIKITINNQFEDLFKKLKEIQNKCNLLLDSYNNVNISSLKNIRESVRDIKLSAIRELDKLKNEINIKQILNDNQIFLDFDTSFKELANLYKEKFNKNIIIFKELNYEVSISITSFITNICDNLRLCLNNALDNQKFNNMNIQINQKLIQPLDQNEIINKLNENKSKRSSLNATNFAKTIAKEVKKQMNKLENESKIQINNTQLGNNFNI